MFTVTVAIDGMSYSAPYHQTRHFKAADLIVGDTIPARLDGEKLILKSSDGKEMKAKITRKARLTSN